MCTKHTVIKYQRSDVKEERRTARRRKRIMKIIKKSRKRGNEEETENYKHVDLYSNNR
jgi:hypothetical protein